MRPLVRALTLPALLLAGCGDDDDGGGADNDAADTEQVETDDGNGAAGGDATTTAEGGGVSWVGVASGDAPRSTVLSAPLEGDAEPLLSLTASES